MVIRSVFIDISIGKNLPIPQSYTPLVWSLLAIVILAAATLSMFIFSQPKVLVRRILRWITRKGGYNDFSCTLQQTFSGHTDFIWNIKWSPDGKWLASSSLDNTICLWEIEKSSPTHILRDHTAMVWSLEWSPNGELLASGSLDGSVCLWKAQTGVLRYTFSDSKDQITSLSWAPDGQRLAFSSLGGSIHLLSIQTEELHQVFSDRTHIIGNLAWSPVGNTIASSLKNEIQLLNVETEQVHQVLVGHANQITCIAWSPNGKTLAIGSLNNEVQLLNVATGQAHQRLLGHTNQITCIAWSPDGKTLAAGSSDTKVQLWNLETGLQSNILEGHIDAIRSLSFSADGRFLSSFSQQDFPYTRGNFRIWHSNSWNLLYNVRNLKGVAPAIFHPKTMTLATTSQEQTSINIWNVNISSLQSIGEASQLEETIHYRNAKVVLVGDSGVGKTGLGLVLAGKTFVPTDSTHGRYVWTFDKREVSSNTQNKEMREILLWDLAGQPGYRLFHQLHLNDIIVALVVFDSRNETDPFAGVRYWDRALQQAYYGQRNLSHPLQKVLVAARVDRGGISASADRIQSFVEELHFQRYFETSAKEPLNIEELKAFIEQAIDWDQLPRVSSTHLFQKIKDFFRTQKEKGRLLSTEDDLYELFFNSCGDEVETEDLRAQFDVCMGQVEATGLIKRLNFGNFVLLQPELIDAYASALINSVRADPDGLGDIDEENVYDGKFSMPYHERHQDKEQERLLCIAMVKDLLRYELVLREEKRLVFPSQSMRERPDFPDTGEKSVVFDFEGPVLNVYATLAVRLANSDFFKKKDIWKNAITYTTTSAEGTCGIFLRHTNEGHGELTLFFDATINEQTRLDFERYIEAYLQRKTLLENLKRRRIFACNECGVVIPEQMVTLRLKHKSTSLPCPACEKTVISLLDREQRLSTSISSLVPAMDHNADQQRERETIKSIIQGKRASNDYDVFLCHNGADKPEIKAIGERLKDQGILPWLDEWELPPGRSWQELLEQQIGQIKSAAVFIGKQGIGPWENRELRAFLSQFVERKCPVIPVFLAEAPDTSIVPLFLKEMTRVDFRNQDPDPFNQLLWGITGERDEI